jgi:hypothetical protein
VILFESIKRGQIPRVLSAVPCLAAIISTVANKKDTMQFMQLVKAFVAFLRKNATPPQYSNQVVVTMIRSMLVLGLVAKHYDVDACMAKYNIGFGISTQDAESPFAHGLYLLLQQVYDGASGINTNVLKYCIQSMTFVFSRLPRLTHEAQPVLQDALHKRPTLFRHTLLCLRRFMESEDHSTDAKAKEGGSGSGQENADPDSDGWLRRKREVSDFLPSFVQQHEFSVLSLCVHEDVQVRLEALKMLAVVLSQGVTNPMDSLPFVYGLLTDREHAIRTVAAKCAQDLDNKGRFNSFMVRRFNAGLRVAFHLQQTVYGGQFDPLQQGKKTKSVGVPFQGLDSLYGLVRESRNSLVQGFVKDLCSLAHFQAAAQEYSASASFNSAMQVDESPSVGVDLDGKSGPLADASSSSSTLNVQEKGHPVKSKKATGVVQVWQKMISAYEDGEGAAFTDPRVRAKREMDFLGFVADFLCQLTYLDDEPLRLVNLLSHVIAREGEVLVEKVERSCRALCRMRGVPSASICDIEEDKNATNDEPIVSEEELVARIQRQCDYGMALSVLVALKSNLQEQYKLTDPRFDNWQMNMTKAKLTEMKVPRLAEVPFTLAHFPFDFTEAAPTSNRGRNARVLPEALERQIAFLIENLADEEEDLLLKSTRKTKKARKKPAAATAKGKKPAAKRKKPPARGRRKAKGKQAWGESSSEDESVELSSSEEEEEESETSQETTQSSSGTSQDSGIVRAKASSLAELASKPKSRSGRPQKIRKL